MINDLRATLRQLEEQYATKLAELTRLRDAISAFHARYLGRLGPLYARLENIRAQVANLKAARARKRLTREYRRAALLVHPDHATDDRDYKRRHEATIAVIEAYRNGDIDGINRAVQDYLSGGLGVSETISDEALALNEQIGKLRALMEQINAEIKDLQSTDIARLMNEVETGEAGGEDPLAEIEAQIEIEIAEEEAELS